MTKTLANFYWHISQSTLTLTVKSIAFLNEAGKTLTSSFISTSFSPLIFHVGKKKLLRLSICLMCFPHSRRIFSSILPCVNLFFLSLQKCLITHQQQYTNDGGFQKSIVTLKHFAGPPEWVDQRHIFLQPFLSRLPAGLPYLQQRGGASLLLVNTRRRCSAERRATTH